MLRVIAILILFSLLGCNNQKFMTVTIPLTQEPKKIKIEPNRYLTTKCLLKFVGQADCEVLVEIPSENTLNLGKGSINYSKSYEWFDAGKTITIYSNDCSKNSFLKISYNFSCSYF